MIKRVFEKAGYPFRPHILRSYFDTAITNARGIPHNIQQFIMGHSGDIEATYTVNKRLPDWQIEEFRQLYSRLIEPKLSTTPQPTQEDLRKRQVLDTVTLLYGNDKEKIRRVEEALAKYATVDEAMDEIRKLVTDAYKVEESTNGGTNMRFESKVVSLDKLTGYLDQGWEYLAGLEGDRFLVRRSR